MDHGARLLCQCVVAAVAVVCSSCTFDLEEVEAVPTSGSDAGDVPLDAADASTEAAWPDGMTAADVAQEVESIDGCWPPLDDELCGLLGIQCGPLQTTDACGQQRDVTCGDCATDAHCEQGICVSYSYAWSTDGWSSCSANCDGGTRTRSVWCARDDGQIVDDANCGGTKPTTSDACNTNPCCQTPAAMQSNRKCSGGTSDIVAWVQFHFGLDDGSPANQAECAAQCTVWAKNASIDAWCCDLVEDTTTGHSYSCAAHTGLITSSFSHPDSDGGYTSLGSCMAP